MNKMAETSAKGPENAIRETKMTENPEKLNKIYGISCKIPPLRVQTYSDVKPHKVGKMTNISFKEAESWFLSLKIDENWHYDKLRSKQWDFRLN